MSDIENAMSIAANALRLEATRPDTTPAGLSTAVVLAFLRALPDLRSDLAASTLYPLCGQCSTQSRA